MFGFFHNKREKHSRRPLKGFNRFFKKSRKDGKEETESGDSVQDQSPRPDWTTLRPDWNTLRPEWTTLRPEWTSPGQSEPSSPDQTELSSPGQTGPSSQNQTGPSSPDQSGPSSPDQTGPNSPDQTPVLCCRAPELENSMRQLGKVLRKANKGFKLQQQFYMDIKEIYLQKEMLLKESLADAKLKHQEALESISPLKEERSELLKSVNTLQSKLQQLEEELHHTRLQRDELQTECQQLRESSKAVLEENEEMRKKLMHKDKIPLKAEKSELTRPVNTLQSKLQKLEKELDHTRLQKEETLREYEQLREACKAVLEEHESMRKKLMHKDEELRKSRADAKLKHQEALESLKQQKEEKSELTKFVNTLQFQLQRLEEDLKHTRLQREELLRNSLADADLKHQEALKSINQLKEEKSELTKSVNTLQSKLRELEEDLHHTRLQKDELQTNSLADADLKHQEALKSINQLKEEKSELTKSVNTLQSKLRELEEDLHHTRLQKDELQTKSRADAELKHQETLESISQLKEEKSELTKFVNTLQSKVHELEKDLHHNHLQKEVLQTEYKKQNEAHRMLLSKYEDIKEEMTDSLADTKLKHQEALESIDHLKEEKSELMKSVNTLQSKVLELEKDLHHTDLQRNELQRVSLADVELKHQKAQESISHLEKEKSELITSVKKLQSSMGELEKELCHTQLQKDELQNAYDQQQEIYRLLLSKYEDMKKEMKVPLGELKKSQVLQPTPLQTPFPRTRQQSGGEKRPSIKTNLNRGLEKMGSMQVAAPDEHCREDSNSSPVEGASSTESQVSLHSPTQSRLLKLRQQLGGEKLLPPIKTIPSKGLEDLSRGMDREDEHCSQGSDSSNVETDSSKKSQVSLHSPSQSRLLKLRQQFGGEKLLPPIKTIPSKGLEDLSRGMDREDEHCSQGSDLSNVETDSSKKSHLKTRPQSGGEKSPPIKTTPSTGSEELSIGEDTEGEDSYLSDEEAASSMKSQVLQHSPPQSRLLKVRQQIGGEKLLPPIKTTPSTGSEELSIGEDTEGEDSYLSDEEAASSMKSQVLQHSPPQSRLLKLRQQFGGEKLVPPIKTTPSTGSEELSIGEDTEGEDSYLSDEEAASSMKSQVLQHSPPQSRLLKVRQQFGGEKLVPPIKTTPSTGSEELSIGEDTEGEDSYLSDEEAASSMKSQVLQHSPPQSRLLKLRQQFGGEKLVPPIKTTPSTGSEDLSGGMNREDEDCSEDSFLSDVGTDSSMKSHLKTRPQSGGEKLTTLKPNTKTIPSMEVDELSIGMDTEDEHFREDSKADPPSDSIDIEEFMMWKVSEDRSLREVQPPPRKTNTPRLLNRRR